MRQLFSLRLICPQQSSVQSQSNTFFSLLDRLLNIGSLTTLRDLLGRRSHKIALKINLSRISPLQCAEFVSLTFAFSSSTLLFFHLKSKLNLNVFIFSPSSLTSFESCFAELEVHPLQF